MIYNISLFIFCAKYPMKQHEGEGLIWAHDRKSKVAGGSLEGEVLLTSQKKMKQKREILVLNRILFPHFLFFLGPQTQQYIQTALPVWKGPHRHTQSYALGPFESYQSNNQINKVSPWSVGHLQHLTINTTLQALSLEGLCSSHNAITHLVHF